MTTSITCHAADLKRALAFAMQPVERRNTIPILGMVRLTGGATGLTIRGTDLDIECFADAAVTSATGKTDVILPPRFLADLLRWATGGVTISRAKDLITIRADDVEATVRELCSIADWPTLEAPHGEIVSIGAGKMHKALAATAACISTEETRYYLRGVFLHDKDGLRAVATDGYRMAIYDIGEAWPFGGMIVPAKAASILRGVTKAGGNGVVFVRAAPCVKNSGGEATHDLTNRIEVSGGGWRIVSRTIDGKYPDYTRVMPKQSPAFTAVLTAAALRRFPKSRDHRPVKIDPTAGRMSWKNDDGIDVSMPVQATGDRAIAFNLKYLLDFAAPAGTIRMESAGPGEPARVLTDDPALLQVLMPVRY